VNRHFDLARIVYVPTVITVLITLSYVAQASARQAIGKLKGEVVDANYARIVDATVTFESSAFRKVVRLNSEGAYEVELPAGTYSVQAAREGFYSRRFKFKVAPNITKRLSMILDVVPLTVPKCPKRLRPCIYL
jgi:hypothetical protein